VRDIDDITAGAARISSSTTR